MNQVEFLRVMSLELNNLSDDPEIREIQILQLQKMIDYQITLEEILNENI